MEQLSCILVIAQFILPFPVSASDNLAIKNRTGENKRTDWIGLLLNPPSVFFNTEIYSFDYESLIISKRYLNDTFASQIYYRFMLS